MRVLRTAAVLILLALSLGTSAFAAKARPEAPPRPVARSAAGVFAPLWRLAVEAWTKEGCTIEPWGRCGASAQTQNADSGCGLEPWGRCSAGH